MFSSTGVWWVPGPSWCCYYSIPYYIVPEYFCRAVGVVLGHIYVPQGLQRQVIEAAMRSYGT